MKMHSGWRIAAAAMAAGMLGVAVAAQGAAGDTFAADGLNYTVLTEDGTQGTVEVGENRQSSGNITIPASVQNGGVEYRVTGIGTLAFLSCTGLTGVTISEGVESIGDHAFEACTQLSEVVIPSTVTDIGKYAFVQCLALTAVTIPAGVTRIEEYTFDACTSLAEATIPEGVTFIGVEAFNDCKALASVTIPGTVTDIEEWAFAASGLTGARIPASAVRVKDNVFEWCNALGDFAAPSFLAGVNWGGGNAVYYPAQRVTFNVNGGSEAPGQAGMERGDGQTYGGLPEASWEEHTFMGWYTAAEGGEAVAAESAVSDEDERTLWAHWWESASETVDGVVWGYTLDGAGTGVTVTNASPADGDVAIPATLGGLPVTGIGANAFIASGLTSVTIPEGVKSIGDLAFYGSMQLATTRIPVSVESIGTGIFGECMTLGDFGAPSFWEGKVDWERGNPVYYPAQIVAFDANGGTCGTAEKRVEGGDGKTYGELPVPEQAWHTFAGWYTAADGGDAVTAESAVSGDNERPLWAHWTDGAEEEAEGATWTGVLDEEGTGVTIVGVKGAFFGVVRIPATLGGMPVTGIGDGAFDGHIDWVGAEIPASVIHVPDGVFAGALMPFAEVKAPRFLQHVNWGGSSIQLHYFDAQLVTFDAAGGTCAPSQKGVEGGGRYGTLPVAEWGDNTFLGWYTAAAGGEPVTEDSEVTGDTERTLWAHWRFVETAGEVTWSFERDASGTGATVMGAEPAEGVLAIPATLGGLPVTGIGEEAFKGCGAMTGVAISESVASIGKGAFAESGLTDARIPVWVLDIGEGVFAGCDALASFEAASFWEGKVDWGNDNAAYYPAQLVTFDANGGTCSTLRMGVERGEGKKYGTLPSAERQGWHFEGWFGEAEGGTKVTAKSAVSDENERTLYAHWAVLTGVSARQRWPWNGLVDIDYEVLEGIDTAGMEVQITVTDPAGSNSWVAQTFLESAEPTAAPGKHRATWDAAADGAGAVPTTNAVAKVSLVKFEAETLYCTIDLSGGAKASSYGVAFSAGPEGDAWGDEAKTSKAVLRRVTRGDWNNGAFQMGGTTETTVSKPYYIGVFPVTQRQWELVTGLKPSYFRRLECYAARPVEQVSWSAIRGETEGAKWPAGSGVDKTSFLGKMRAKSGLATLDLPTEAQWEFACRAGTETDYNSGKNFTSTNGQDDAMGEVGRYAYNGGGNYGESCGTDGGTAAVGAYAANAWGLYDMHGNVWEWCLDWWGDELPGGTDPKGAESGEMRVMRGGAWNEFAGSCTSSARKKGVAGQSGFDGGFRLAWTPAAGEVPTTEVASKTSGKFRLDTRSGARESTGEETVAYSALWAGGEGGTVTLAADGVAFAEGLDGEGVQAWSAPYDGTYTLTHETVAGGVTGAVETAQFTVSGKGDSPRELYEAWLEERGLEETESVGFEIRHEDADGDGVSNWLEFLADTNPIDPDEHFQLSATMDADGNVLLSSGEFSAARRYSLLVYTDLSAQPAETDLGPGIPGMVLTNHPAGTQFLRVKAGMK